MLNPSQILEFLQSVEPFGQLPSSALEQLSHSIQISSYPKDAVIYTYAQTPIQSLSIIQEGKVEKYFLNDRGEKEFREYFESGDSFGEVSILLNYTASLSNTRALDDTTLLQIPRAYFRELCQEYPYIYEYYTSRLGKRVLDEKYGRYLRGMSDKSSGLGQSDYYFHQSVGEVALKHIYCCPTDTSIQEAARLMHHYKTGYIIVKDEAEKFLGILTDLDLKAKVVAQALDVHLPVTEIMSTPLISIAEEAKVYEAILKMYRLKINYLLTGEKGNYKGLLTRNKLLFHQQKSPFLFVQSLQNATHSQELKMAWTQVPALIDELFNRAPKAETANEVISSIIDAISHNITERAIFQLQKIPVRFAFIALGSEGRKEQTLKTDQDNAIIFEDVHESRRAEVQQYFLKLGQLISDELNEAGFSYCKGNFMASNPKWCQPLSQWKAYYKDWIGSARGEDLLNAIIFFDARNIYGDGELLEDLRIEVAEQLNQAPGFFYLSLAKSTLSNRPPLNVFTGFQLVQKEEKKKVLDLKVAMRIIIDFARIYSLKHQIRQTNTGARLKALRDKAILSEADFNELFQAYYYMMQLRLRNQVRQINQWKEAPSNYLSPKSITQVERVALKEVFKIIKKFQSRLSIDFTGSLGH